MLYGCKYGKNAPKSGLVDRSPQPISRWVWKTASKVHEHRILDNHSREPHQLPFLDMAEKNHESRQMQNQKNSCQHPELRMLSQMLTTVAYEIPEQNRRETGESPPSNECFVAPPTLYHEHHPGKCNSDQDIENVIPHAATYAISSLSRGGHRHPLYSA